MSHLEPLRQAVAVSPTNIPLLLLLAQACVDEWSLGEAREVFEKILTLDAAQIDARLGIARMLFLTGKTSEAVVRVEALLQSNPDFAQAWLLASQLALSERSLDTARKYYEKALKINGSLRDTALEKELYLEGPAKTSGAGPQKVAVGAPTWDDSDDEDEDLPSSPFAEFERPKLTFADVGGMDSVKEEIRMKIIHPLQNPDLFRAYGKKPGGGVLLYGPPGCGKTLLSRATAGEIQANFLAIGIHQILDLYLGNSEKNLHQIFQLARDHAPSVLFFDEVDALAADRNDMKRSAGRTLINQFLAELDSGDDANEGVLVLGATNAPWHIDPAFRRPGRFDRILFVPPPDEKAREAVIEVMARNKPVEKLNAAALAKKTRDFSGADLKAVFDLTIERTLSKALKEGRVVPVTTDDLISSTKLVKPSAKAWFDSAKNYAIYSNQGGFYDDVLSYLGIKK